MNRATTNMPTVLRPRAAYVWIWFALDAFLSLFPPVYWVAAQPKPKLFGFPCSIIYFGALGIFITASLLAAYWDDETRGAFKVAIPVGQALPLSGSEN
jgi:hypothetical protein